MKTAASKTEPVEGPASAGLTFTTAGINDREFSLFQGLIYREAGIYLSDVKRALLVGRLARRLRQLGLTSFQSYYDHVVASGSEELTTLLDHVSTNETHFFREPQHFAFVRERVIPEWRARVAQAVMPRRVRIWSAGCSSGEEPYSIAMLLIDQLPPEEGWSIEIIATDLSTRVLAKAREGLWNIERAQHIPESYLKRFMLRGIGSQAGKMKAGKEVRDVIQFARLNLNDTSYALAGRFDLIFCRNVLIYFNTESRDGVIGRLLGHLHPEGYLFVGHAETLSAHGKELKAVAPTVYGWAHQPRSEASK